MQPHYIVDDEILDKVSETPLELAYVTEAKPEHVEQLLALPVMEDGRSSWHWVRLRDGTLMLATFPQGDTYMQLSDAGVCDFGED